MQLNVIVQEHKRPLTKHNKLNKLYAFTRIGQRIKYGTPSSKNKRQNGVKWVRIKEYVQDGNEQSEMHLVILHYFLVYSTYNDCKKRKLISSFLKCLRNLISNLLTNICKAQLHVFLRRPLTSAHKFPWSTVKSSRLQYQNRR